MVVGGMATATGGSAGVSMPATGAAGCGVRSVPLSAVTCGTAQTTGAAGCGPDAQKAWAASNRIGSGGWASGEPSKLWTAGSSKDSQSDEGSVAATAMAGRMSASHSMGSPTRRLTGESERTHVTRSSVSPTEGDAEIPVAV